MGIRLLGPASVDADETLRPRDRRVLCALAVRRGEILTAVEVADAVWGNAPPESWPKQVQICVARLRKVLDPGAIETVGGGYRLCSESVELDVADFERLVARGRALMQVEEPDRAAATFARARALWRGIPFGDLDGWAPAYAERTRLEELHRSLDEELLDARLMSGEHRDVAARAEALVAADPLRERRWAILARAQYRCGRQADALGSLHRARRLLADQLGVDPGPELVDLEAAILRQEPALLAVPELRSISDDCPYKGLSYYDAGDDLFGRDAEIEACLSRLRSSSLLVLAGPSGCGKSSLLRAGVVATLQAQGRSTVLIVPTADGKLAIPDSSRGTDPPPVLVVDQLEELFVVGHSTASVRDTFSRLAAYSRDVGPVLTAVRADHLADLAANESLGRLVEQGLHLVRPLTGDALREAIERPAAEAGLRIEEGLVDLLVRDTEGEPGALPLLSHALAETWVRRDGNVLTVEGYRATGGIRGAVSRSAERLYDGLPPAQRSVVRALLLRLVARSVDGDPIRCRVQASRLQGDPDRERVLALLIRDRLVTAADEVVEISHEALARAWPRLQSWLDDDSAGQRVMRHLTAAADGWDSLGRPDSELYRGARLATAMEYRQSPHPDLPPLEGRYLDTSAAHADLERSAVEARAVYDVRRNRRLRVLLAAALALLVVAVTAGGVAVLNGREAGDQRDVARAAIASAQLEALVNSSLAMRSTDRDVAALLAVEASRRWPGDPRALSALLGTFTGSPGFLGYQYVEDARSITGALVPGSASAVVAVDGRRLELHDLGSGEVLDRLESAGSAESFDRRVAVSGDGRLAVVLRGLDTARCFDLAELRITNGDGCAELVVHDLSTGARVLGPITPPVGPGDVAINDDGSLVAVAGGYDGALVVYRTDDGSRVVAVDGLPRPADAQQRLDSAAVAFGRDDRVYLGSLSGPVRVVDPANGAVVDSIAVPAYSSNQHVAVADDVVVTGGPEWLVAADVGTGRRTWQQDLRGRHPDPCPYFAVSPVADTVYCGNHFGQIEQRDSRTGQRTGTVLDPQLGDVGRLALSDDGEQLVAFGAQVPAISSWRLDGGGLVTRLVAAGHVVADGYDFADGSTILVAARSASSTVDGDFDDFAVWDPEGDVEVDPMSHPLIGTGWAGRGTVAGVEPGTERLAWYDVQRRTVVPGALITTDCDHLWASAGGERAYCGLLDGDVWTLDVATRQRLDPVIHAPGMASAVSATRDGAVVVVTASGPDGPVTTVHDGTTGRPLATALQGRPDITSVSLDGVLVGATGGTLTRYDLETGAAIAEFPGARGEINTLQFSDDGRLLLATSNDQTASLYDVATGIRLGDPIPSDAPFLYPAFLRHDGTGLAVTSARGVAVWDLDPAHLRHAACRLAGRNLSGTEWSTHLADLGELRETCDAFLAPR